LGGADISAPPDLFYELLITSFTMFTALAKKCTYASYLSIFMELTMLRPSYGAGTFAMVDRSDQEIFIANWFIY